MNPEFIIRIIVRARNEIAGVLEKAAGDVDRLTGAQDRNVKSGKDVQKQARELRKEYDEFSASVKRGEKSADDAVFGLRRLSAEMDKLAKQRPIGDPLGEQLNRGSLAARRQVAEIEEIRRVRQRATEQEIADRGRAMQSRLKERSGERDLRQEVENTIRAFENFHSEVRNGDHDVNRARSGYKQFGNEFSTLQRKFKAGSDEALRLGEHAEASRMHMSNLSEDVKRAGQSADHAGGAFRRLFNVDPAKLERINQRLAEFERAANRSRFSVAAFDNRLRGLLVLGVFAFFQQLTSVVIGLGGALVSVASTAVQAGAALGGALVAGAAQAIPMIGLLISAFGRIGAVFKTVQQAQKSSMAAGYDHIQQLDKQRAAADSVKNAQEGLAQSHRQVADANRRVTDAQIALNQARFDGRRQLEDLITAERRARLEQESARLAESDAAAALEKAVASGDISQQAGLELRLKEAQAARGAAGTAASRATEDRQRAAARGGLEGLDSVRSARNSLDDARRGVADAERGVEKARRSLQGAQRDAANTQKQMAAVDRTLSQMLAQLSPAERQLYEAMRRLQATYKRLFRPITDIVVGGFTDAVTAVTKTMADPRVLGTFRGLADGVRTQMGRITRDLTSDNNINFFQRMGKEAERNIGPLTSIALHLLQIARNIADAASPALHDFIMYLDDLTKKGVDSTSGAGGIAKLERFFTQGEHYAEGIAHLVGALVRLAGALVGVSATEGMSLIDDLTQKINDASAWINQNQDRTRQFFADAGKVTREVAGVLWDMARALFALFDPERVQTLGDVITKSVLPSLTAVLHVTGAVTDVLLKLTGGGIGSSLFQLALSGGLLYKAFSPLLSIGGRLIVILGTIASSERLVGRGLVALELATGPLGKGIAVVVAAVALLDQKFHFLKPILDAIRGIFDKFGDFVHHNPFAELAGGVIAFTGAIKLLRLALDLLGKSFAPMTKLLGNFKRDAGEAAGAEGKLAAETRATNRATQGSTTPGGIIMTGRRGTREVDPATGAPVPGTAGEAGATMTRRERLRRGLGRAGRFGAGLALLGGAQGFIDPTAGQDDPYSHPDLGNRVQGLAAGPLSLVGIDISPKAPTLAQQMGAVRSRIDSLASEGNIKKLKEVRDAAVTMKGVRPEYKQYLDEVIKRIDQLKGLAPSVRRALESIKGPRFQDLGSIMMQVRGSLDGLSKPARAAGANAIIELTRSMEKQGRVAVGTTDKLIRQIAGRYPDLVESLRKSGHQSMEALNNEFKNRKVLSSVKDLVNSAADDFGGIPRAADVNFRNLPVVAEPALERLRKLTHSKNSAIADQAKKDYRRLNNAIEDAYAAQENTNTKHWRDVTRTAVTKTAQMATLASGNFGDLTDALATGMWNIRTNVNNSLGAFGVKKLNYDIKKVGKQIQSLASGAAKQAGAAAGGWLGNQGERGPDGTGPNIRGRETGRGEAVLNWAHQKFVEPAMAWSKATGGPSPYGSLTELFSKVRAQHAAGMGLARGGFANLFDGHPTNVAPGVKQLIETMKKHFPLVVTSTTDHSLMTTSGNISDHSTGHAVDLSASAAVMHAAAEWIKTSGLYRKLKQGIHNPNLAVNRGQLETPPGIFAGAVWAQHLSHLHLAIMGALGKFAGGDFSGDVPRQKLDGPGGPLHSLGQKVLDRAHGAAQKYINRQMPGMDAAGAIISDYHGPLDRIFPRHGSGQGGVQFSAAQVAKIAESVGLPGGLFAQIAHGESNYQPGVVSTDGGYGLWQITPRVQGAAVLDFIRSLGGIGKLLNPIINAKVAKYLYRAAGNTIKPWFGTRYVTGANEGGFLPSFETGGEVDGHRGQARPIIAHAREWVVNEMQQSRLAQWLGTTRDRLKGSLGFTGGPNAFAGGGEVGIDHRLFVIERIVDLLAKTASFAASRGGGRSVGVDDLNRPFSVDTIHDITPQGLTILAQRAVGYMAQISRRSKDFYDNLNGAFNKLAGDGGILDELDQSIQKLTTNLETQLQRTTYRINSAGKVVLRLNPQRAAEQGLRNLEREYGDLVGERGEIDKGLSAISKRIGDVRKHSAEVVRHLRKGGVTAKEQKQLDEIKKNSGLTDEDQAEFEKLTGFRRNLRDRRDTVRAGIAANIEARYQQEEAIVQARVDASTDRATSRLGRADIRGRVQAITGLGDPQAVARMRERALGDQVKELQAAAATARRLGRRDLARKIGDQIADLQTQMLEAAQQGLIASIDKVNQLAQRRQGLLDIRGRLADLREKAGDFEGAFQDRASVLAARGSALIDQRSGLQQLLLQAQRSGQLAVVDQLSDQLADLDATIKENIAAIDSNTVQWRQARIDAITNRGSFLGGVFGTGLPGILQAIAANSGVLDTDAMKALLGQQGTTLGQTGSGLRNQLLSGYGINLMGLSPAELVSKLSGLDYDQIEMNFTPEQRAQFEALINAIIDNATANEQNTTALKELTAPTTQTWASTAWQWFRSAVFNGAGGLLQRYQIPSMDTGGKLMSDGIYYGHAGERVVAANVQHGVGGDVFAPSITNVERVQDMDEETLKNKLMFAYKTRSK
jgi:chromosome segregation ATPase